MRRLIHAMLAILITFNFAPQSNAATPIQVSSVFDGDTLKLGDGMSVRLLQIDTPEVKGNECYWREARLALVNLLNKRGTLRLAMDPRIEEVDSHGRLLRYVFKGRVNVNLEMVKIGAATPWFYKKVKGQYAEELLAAAENARANKLGLWAACPGTKLDPYKAVTTVTQVLTPSPGQCDPNYDGCIPVFPPDLNCGDIKKLGLAPVKVIGRDVHRLDADGDGIACTP
ncbi:MAG: thermonuclease family protein [Actinomycetota bacterium]